MKALPRKPPAKVARRSISKKMLTESTDVVSYDLVSIKQSQICWTGKRVGGCGQFNETRCLSEAITAGWPVTSRRSLLVRPQPPMSVFLPERQGDSGIEMPVARVVTNGQSEQNVCEGERMRMNIRRSTNACGKISALFAVIVGSPI